MLRKTKQPGGDIAGDWSTTGTFLRKPAGGWLHEDRELKNGLCVNYSVQYLGSIIINNSMRTLQFSVRTQVTKEAILRLAEHSGNVFIGKKKKVPKQVDKTLGGMDVRWAGEANLSVSVESLKISNELGGMVIFNHALPSISFASGGDGATAEYIGYVAKDPVHGRACHVFECPRSSQFVLATIGQAFELRYKMYLNSPRSNAQPVDVGSSWDEEAWGQQGARPDEGRVIHTIADIHPVSNFRRNQPPPATIDEEESGGIYSDIPDLPDLPPPDSTPPPIPSARYTLAERPPSHDKGHGASPRPQLENPYDTMEMSIAGRKAPTSIKYSGGSRNDYEDADLIVASTNAPTTTTTSAAAIATPTASSTAISNGSARGHVEGEEYSTTFISIRQSRINDSLDQIDLTPPPSSCPDYTNVSPSPPMKKRLPTKPTPFKRKDSPGQGKVPITTTTTTTTAAIAGLSSSNGTTALQGPTQDYDEIDPVRALGNHPLTVNTPSSTSPKPSPPTRSSYDPPISLKAKPPVKKKPTLTSQTKPGLYDDPNEIIAAKKRMRPTKPSRQDIVNGMLDSKGAEDDLPEENVYNTPEGLYDDSGRNLLEMGGSTVPPSPKFDDGIYMDSSGAAPKRMGLNRMAPVATSLPDPLASLTQQRYFHGTLSRVEAEALLMSDGEFMIRESTKKPGQYVLTGMATGKPQHLLLMDKEGRVKSKDREFESVPHLIKHFTESKLPLVIGNSQVFLKKPVINAFLSNT